MSNIIDYIMWRGDITFSEKKINEIDKLIFMRLSYLPFNELNLSKEDSISISDLMKRLSNIPADKFIWNEDINLINKLGISNRFKDLIISDYVEKYDKSLEKQFAAIVISGENINEHIISYRGTDMSLVGWKEDFNMSFTYHVPSQIEGVNYLNYIGNKYGDKVFLLLGHSKGGNIAMYSSIFCNDLIKLRIKEIITADSPGLTEEIVNDIRFLDIKDKIISYIPQTSIVGRLLENTNNYRVVQSSGNMFVQHDIYTWDVGPTFLIQIKDASKESDFANNVIKDYLKKTSPQDREKFITIVYEVLESLEVENITDIPKVLLKNTKIVLKGYKDITPEDKLQLEDMMKQLKDIIIENIKLELVSQNIIKDNKKIDKTKNKKRLKANKEKNGKKIKKEEKSLVNKEKKWMFGKK